MEMSSRAAYLFPAAIVVIGLIYVSGQNSSSSPLDAPLTMRWGQSPAASSGTSLPDVGERLPETFARSEQQPPQSSAERFVSRQSDSQLMTAGRGRQSPRLPQPAQPYSDPPSIEMRATSQIPESYPHPAEVGAAVANQSRPSPPLPAVSIGPEHMQSAIQQSMRLLEQGKRLAERRATKIAETEFRRSMVVLAEALDATDGGERRLALDRAFIAFEEANDFFEMSRRVRKADVANIVLSHDTPALQEVDSRAMPLRVAMEQYFTYGQAEMVKALGALPQGAEPAFFLGKLYKSLADSAGDQTLDGPKAMALYQAALRINPRHHLAANELGVMLGSYGQWSSAKEILLQSLRAQPTMEAWRNLSVVHSRLGEANLAQLAATEASMLAQRRAVAAPATASRDINQMVRWVSPQEFDSFNPEYGPAAAPMQAPPLAPSRQAQSNRVQANPVSSPQSILRSPWRTPQGR